MKVSRRRLAQTLVGGAAAATLSGQTPPKPSPAVETSQAQSQLRNAALIVRAVPVPMSTEPATRFQARA